MEIGEKVPDIELIDTELKPVRLSNFKGKVVVLAFYPAAFTSIKKCAPLGTHYLSLITLMLSCWE